MVFCNVEDGPGHHEDVDGEADAAKEEEERSVAAGEPMSERQAPVGSVNGQSDTDDKENNNDTGTEGTQAVRYGTHPANYCLWEITYIHIVNQTMSFFFFFMNFVSPTSYQ